MARTVRRYARDRVIAGGRGSLADEAETVVAELFSNAVFAQMHARIMTVIPVQCLVQGLMVVVDVYDHAPGYPYFKPVSGWAESGRGLQMVRTLTNGAVGWAPWGTGKVVSAMLGGLKVGYGLEGYSSTHIAGVADAAFQLALMRDTYPDLAQVGSR